MSIIIKVKIIVIIIAVEKMKLDNNETEELDDGFLSVASAFFESIDSDAAQVLMFGISSVLAISILRAVFRR